MERLTHFGLINLQEVVRLDDLLLLPRDSDIPVEATRALEIRGLLPASPNGLAVSNMYAVMLLQDRYDAERSGDTEPSWIADAPVLVRKRLRLMYAMREEASEIIAQLPFTGISFAITDDGLHFALCRACNVWRLAEIKQLGFLQAPSPNHELLGSQPLSEGSRYTHTVDVMAIATLIAHNLQLPRSLYNTTRAAAILHDIGTPAGGDSVKMVDIEGLDEDLNFPELLARFKVDQVLAQYEIDRGVLCEAILNRGIAGEILDIADKLAYTGRDIKNTRHHIVAVAGSTAQPGLKTLAEYLDRYGDVCSIWDDVVECDGHVAFRDPARLGAFLRVRALMFREFYYHPRARFAEFLVSRLIVKALYRRGVVTRESLRVMSDWELIRIMEQEYGTGPHSLGRSFDADLARVESFSTFEEARAFANRLQSRGIRLVMVDDDRKAIKTGANLFVALNGKAVPLWQAMPSDVCEIEEIAQLYPMVRVYYIDGTPNIPEEKLNELMHELEP